MKKWPWIIYGCFLTLLVVESLSDLVYPDSPLRTYYTVLLAFNKNYIISFGLNILNIIINISAPLAVLFYAFNVKSSTRFWSVLFFIRILFDLIGHHYDLQFIKAAYFQSFPYFLACIGAFTLPVIPSYIAHYLYAFRKRNDTNT